MERQAKKKKKKAVSISINYSWPPGWQSIGASIACQLNRPILAKTLLGWFGFFIWTQIIGLEMQGGTTWLAAIASLMGILTSLYNKVYRAITGHIWADSFTKTASCEAQIFDKWPYVDCHRRRAEKQTEAVRTDFRGTGQTEGALTSPLGQHFDCLEWLPF